MRYLKVAIGSKDWIAGRPYEIWILKMLTEIQVPIASNVALLGTD